MYKLWTKKINMLQKYGFLSAEFFICNLQSSQTQNNSM